MAALLMEARDIITLDVFKCVLLAKCNHETFETWLLAYSMKSKVIDDS